MAGTLLIMPYVLPLLLLLLSLSIFFFFHKKSSDNPKNLPPGSDGWPVLGENLEFALYGLQKFIRHRMEKYSVEVFRTSLLGERFVVLCGPQGNKFVFSNDDKHVTPWLPPAFRKVVLPDFGKTSFKESVSLFRSFQQVTLHHEVLRGYVPAMDSLARQHLENYWKPNTAVEVLPLIKKYVFDLSCKLFLSMMDPDSVRRLSDPFHVMVDGLLSLPLDFPGTPFRRAIQASTVMRGEMTRIVKERRKETETETEGKDLLSKLLNYTDEDGEYVSDDKISNFIVGLFMAGFDATSSSLTAVIYYLAKLPHIYEQVLQEQMAIAKSKGPDEELRWEDFEKMNYSKNVHKESLRRVPITGIFRESIAEFNYAGFTIPKGWKIMWTSHTTHNNPDYFPEPEKFDPSRFEGSGPAPNTFVPFGGGARMCPGRNYAKLAILVFIHNLVTRFRLEETIPNEKMLFHRFTPVPAHGLPLRLLPHPK